jgi:two-component system response regulator FlrC
VPALRNRPGDILPLVASLLVRHGQSNEAFTVSDEAQAKLVSYPWPGNVRELENVVQRAVVLCSDNHIDLSHLMFDDASEMLVSEDSSTLEPSEGFQAARALSSMAAETPAAFSGALPSIPTSTVLSSLPAYQAAPMAQAAPAANLQEAVKSNEHQLILAAIETTESRIEAARKLGISPRTLRYKMAKLKLDTPNMASAY